MPFTKADLEEVEEVATKKVATDVLRSQGYLKIESSNCFVPETQPVEMRYQHGTRGRSEPQRPTSEEIDIEHRGEGAVEDASLGTAVQMGVDVHREGRSLRGRDPKCD